MSLQEATASMSVSLVKAIQKVLLCFQMTENSPVSPLTGTPVPLGHDSAPKVSSPRAAKGPFSNGYITGGGFSRSIWGSTQLRSHHGTLALCPQGSGETSGVMVRLEEVGRCGPTPILSQRVLSTGETGKAFERQLSGPGANQEDKGGHEFFVVSPLRTGNPEREDDLYEVTLIMWRRGPTR